MQPTDLTIEILKGIRDEVHAVRNEVHDTNTRLDVLRGDTNAGLDRLERRQTETEIRLSTELMAVVGAVQEVRDLLAEDRSLRSQVSDHERRLTAVEDRIR